MIEEMKKRIAELVEFEHELLKALETDATKPKEFKWTASQRLGIIEVYSLVKEAICSCKLHIELCLASKWQDAEFAYYRDRRIIYILLDSFQERFRSRT